MRIRWLTGCSLVILVLALTGCPPKKQVKKTDVVLPPKPAVTTAPPEEPSLRNKEYAENADLQAVYFPLDQSSLTADARSSLQKNYEVLKGHADWEALIEGHCDERGSTEYNLGLGQRRAAAVREYYMSLGLDGTQIATLSYGKEKPVCAQHGEPCWSQNRRAVTKVRSTQVKG